MKKLTLLLFLQLTIFVSYTQSLHLILVTDVQDARLGIHSIKDESKVFLLFKKVAENLSYSLKPVYLNRANFTAKAVTNAVQKLPSITNDIIVIYYLGYSSVSVQNNSAQIFNLKDSKSNPLSVNKLGDLLKSKRSYLRLIFADFRENDAYQIITDDLDVVASFGLNTDYTRPVVKSLFNNSCGMIIAISNLANQKAALQSTVTNTIRSVNEPGKVLESDTVVNGGAFTTNLLQSFTNNFKRNEPSEMATLNLENLLVGTNNVLKYILKTADGNTYNQTLNIQKYGCAGQQSTTNFGNSLAPNAINKNWPYVYPYGFEQIETAFNYLISIKNNNERKKYNYRLIDIFYEPGAPTLTVNKITPTQNRSITLSPMEYLRQLNSYNPNLTQIKIIDGNFFDKSTSSLIIEETWLK